MIGLFLGDTDFSEIVLKKIKKLKKEYFIIDFSKNNKFKSDKNSYRISIGKFGKIINLIKEKKCKKVLFAGKIAKPNFSSLRLDFKGIIHVAGLSTFWFATEKLIRESTKNTLIICLNKKINSVAFQLIGAGTGGEKKNYLLNLLAIGSKTILP